MHKNLSLLLRSDQSFLERGLGNNLLFTKGFPQVSRAGRAKKIPAENPQGFESVISALYTSESYTADDELREEEINDNANAEEIGFEEENNTPNEEPKTEEDGFDDIPYDPGF